MTEQFANSPDDRYADLYKKRSCVFCGEAVTSTNPDTEFCVGCYYDGTFLNAAHAGLLAELPAGAYWRHTGGGCFCLQVDFPDGSFVWASADQDAGQPENGEDGPWWVFRYGVDREAFLDGDDEGTLVGEHLDRAGLLTAVAQEASK